MKKIRKNSGLQQDVRFVRGFFYLVAPDPDGRQAVPVRQIGKGLFSKAYLTKSGTPYVYLITKEGAKGADYAKRMLSDLTEDEEFSPYLPRVTAVGCLPTDECVYRMPLYNAPLKKNKDAPLAWEQYRMLESCLEEAKNQVFWSAFPRGINMTYLGHALMDAVVVCAENKGAEPGLIRALTLLKDTAGDYGADYAFEFSPRNLATTDNGHLILLDTVFSMKSVRERRLEGKGR
jgi:hypothetical protein